MNIASWILFLMGALAAVAAAAPKSPPDPAAVAAGAKLYAQYCAVCHGKAGRGDGAGAASLKPRNFREPKQLKSKTDEDLFKVISKGGPALGLKEPQIRQVVGFVRSMIDSSAAAGAAAKGK